MIYVTVQAINFPYEKITLSESDTLNNPSLAFGNLSIPPIASSSRCKLFPGDKEWPSDSQWTAFNETLDGALIKGVPPAVVCYNITGMYDAAKWAVATTKYFDGQARTDDAVSIENEWLDGDSCPAQAYNNVPGGNTTAPTCDLDAYPAYVVNVTTVKRKFFPVFSSQFLLFMLFFLWRARETFA